MCGRYNVIDDPIVRDLMEALGMPVYPPTRLNIAPGAQAEFVFEDAQGRKLQTGYWSLLIEPRPDGTGYRPSPQYSTFNARAGSLGSSPLWKQRFQSRRAIIPASGFHEWTGQKGHKQCYNIAATTGAIAFAGLYELWEFQDEIVPSFTIITLPPHPRFSHIHPKSLPLMLRPEDFDAWLDPGLHNTDPFQNLLKSHLSVPLNVVPIRSPENLTAVGAAENIAKDEG